MKRYNKYLYTLLLVLMSGVIISCDNNVEEEEIMDEPYRPWLQFAFTMKIEDKSGADLTETIYNNYKNEKYPKQPIFRYSVPYNDGILKRYFEPSLTEEKTLLFCPTGYYSTFDLQMLLFVEDKDSVEFYGRVINRKPGVLQWEFKGENVPFSEKTRCVTNATLVRDDDGTYTLKK